MPLLDLFVATLWIFLFVAWIWLLVGVFADIFRSEDLGGGAKAVWTIFVLLLPFLGVFVYLIARGGKMQDRQMSAAAEAERARQEYIRGVATASTPSTADELAKLAQLRDQGVIDLTEYENQKAKLLA
jgi:ABC-type multidrug transport system fused ATPase/permease subunit